MLLFRNHAIQLVFDKIEGKHPIFTAILLLIKIKVSRKLSIPIQIKKRMILKPRKRRKPKIRRYIVKSESDEFIIRGNIIISEKAHYNSELPYNKMILNGADDDMIDAWQTFRINYNQFKNSERFKGRVKAEFRCKDPKEVQEELQEKLSNLSEEDEESELEEELRRMSFTYKLNLVLDEDKDGYDIYRFARNKAFKTYYSEAKKLIQEVLNEESKRF